jgi:predicted AAA+ superfamily ATPase
MNQLIENSDKQIDLVPSNFIRDYISTIDWNNRLIGIKGSRGVGKTTLLLQYIKLNNLKEKAIYISLDDLYFTDNKLIDFADSFAKKGGEYIFIDEVHFYKNWSQEIKLIYDRFPNLKIVFTGSSILQLNIGKSDLSRRAVINELRGFSFREFLNYNEKTDFEVYKLEEILENHRTIASEIRKKILPIAKFDEYLKIGYYPFFIENKQQYLYKLKNIINLILEVDLHKAIEITQGSIDKIRQLIYIVATSVPFKPNISKLSEKIGVTRNSLKLFFNLLEESQIIHQLHNSVKGVSLLSKPEKIYLYHPNLLFAIADANTNVGNLRETFFINQLSAKHKVDYNEIGDFFVDDKYIFEVGGKNKTRKQIAGIKNSYTAKDDIETGYENEIPLWLFGFLY